MALTKSLWTTIVDLVSTGQNVSDNLDVAFTNIDTAIEAIDTNTTDVAAIDVRVTELEAEVADAVSLITVSPLATQSLVASVPEKLFWATSALVDAGGTSISHDIVTQNILITEAGTYRVYGVVSALAPVNDIVEIELYIDNLPTGFASSCIGRGTGSMVTYTYSFLTPFVVNDDINLYVTSTGTEVTIQSASMTVEKTKY